MKLYFAKNELKDWVDYVLAFGIYKLIIEDKDITNLALFLICFILGIVAQVLALILSPISLILTLLIATKIRRY